ncbi:PREDICTED: cyclic nucleotide-gated ion channel 1-like [Prunus mume]|uniref:Cyclic nucleotide-gated ion channel 1-like n=1 Tax=Prunus mume TaxID=102107 RepID=A0ABM0P2Q7_PRUMU|nr:PREDICTED: cyclic nucleotide-gated ion channel 1-like [Prunus mume]
MGLSVAIFALITAAIEFIFLLMELPFHWIYSKWKKIFVISCVFAVLLDPLFLYIPIIKEDMKCIQMDKRLNKTAFALRSVTDLSYFVDIIVQYHRFQRIWRSYILIDILAILPLPQVVILIFFSKGRGPFKTRKLMNSLVLLQYMPRVLRIYFSCKEFKESPYENIKLWIKGVLNFFLYILASHVLGAFWYFFAIQRMTTCWKIACQTGNRCESSTNFVCEDNQFRNTTLLNDLCPINSPNVTLFDFGIFVGVLQSGISESTNFPQKFSNCFWWGLRNLSSLGSNLQPSINTWENLFAASISVIGLLLFCYLIGNLQTYMQSESDPAKVEARKIKFEKKLDEKGTEIENWLSKNVILESDKDNLKLEVMKTVKQELKQGRDVDVENILFILPFKLRNYINSCKMLEKLKAIPKLQSMDEVVLKAMSKHLTLKKYAANSYIIKENEPLGMMLLIVDGDVKVESSNEVSSRLLKTGDFYGEELLDWVKVSLFPSLLPLSTSTAWAFKDVEARLLMASDLCAVAAFYREHFSENTFSPPPVDVQFNRLGLAKYSRVAE